MLFQVGARSSSHHWIDDWLSWTILFCSFFSAYLRSAYLVSSQRCIGELFCRFGFYRATKAMPSFLCAKKKQKTLRLPKFGYIFSIASGRILTRCAQTENASFRKRNWKCFTPNFQGRKEKTREEFSNWRWNFTHTNRHRADFFKAGCTQYCPLKPDFVIQLESILTIIRILTQVWLSCRIDSSRMTRWISSTERYWGWKK